MVRFCSRLWWLDIDEQVGLSSVGQHPVSLIFLLRPGLQLRHVVLMEIVGTVKSKGKHTTNAKSLQSCPTLCDPRDGSPPGSAVPGILQARIQEWVAISFSNAWKWKVKGKSLSHVRLLATPWTVAHQAPPSMGFSRQEYWSLVPLPSPREAYKIS